MKRQAYPRLAVLVLAAILASAIPVGAQTDSPSQLLAAWHPTVYQVTTNSNNMPVNLTSGPDGALWFTQYHNLIGRLTTQGAVTEFPISVAYPGAITAGPDGALWFTSIQPNQIGRITTAGAETEYPLPVQGTWELTDITQGPGSRVWYADMNPNAGVGWITTQGQIYEYVTGGGNGAQSIAMSPDGTIWFVDEFNNIGHLTSAGLTKYPIPTPASSSAYLTPGPDGAMWFAEINTNKIGRITTGGQITEYALPGANVHVYGLTAGPGGALWFTQYGNGTAAIGAVTALGTPGTISEYALPGGSEPTGIIQGPDGALWFLMLPYDVVRLGP